MRSYLDDLGDLHRVHEEVACSSCVQVALDSG